MKSVQDDLVGKTTDDNSEEYEYEYYDEEEESQE